MTDNLTDLKVAILVASGFEESELSEPLEILAREGLISDIISPEKKTVKGWSGTGWGDEFSVDVSLDRACPEDYDALFLPGALMNPEKLRKSRKAAEFVSSFFTAGKPVGALCHGPWTMLEQGAARGRETHAYHTVRTSFRDFVARLRAAAPPTASDRAAEEDPARPGGQQMILWLDQPRRSRLRPAAVAPAQTPMEA